SCQNNLKQICLASHNYESSNGVLPPGMDRTMAGALAYMLPYLEADAVFQRFNFQTGKYLAAPQTPPPVWYSAALLPVNRPPAGSPLDGSPGWTVPPPDKDIKSFIFPNARAKGVPTTLLLSAPPI